MQASCIKTSDALVDAADTNTKASLPVAPHGFFWLEHPRGRMPGHVALSCCSAPHPLGQSGYSPVWFVKPPQSTEGNPLWRSCRYASSLAPQRCPALWEKTVKTFRYYLHGFITHTSMSVRFWKCLKCLRSYFLFTTGQKKIFTAINYEAFVCSVNFCISPDDEEQQHWTHLSARTPKQ